MSSPRRRDLCKAMQLSRVGYEQRYFLSLESA